MSNPITDLRLGQKKCSKCGAITSSSILDKCFCDREPLNFEPINPPNFDNSKRNYDRGYDKAFNKEKND